MPGSEPSPLVAIREKERSLAQDLKAVQERSEAQIASARQRADEIKQQAERAGMSEADALYQQGLQRAREQAQVITQEGEAQAAKLRTAGMERVGKAVDYILQFVLPSQ